MIFLQIASGVALVLFGVRFLRKGLDRLFGAHLMHWMERMTNHRLKGFAAGVIAGAVAPSSTAISVMLVQLLNASQLQAARTLAVMLGANIGITVMVQFLSFSVSGVATMCLLLGVIGFQGLQRNVFRGIGQCLLALGFVFLAMQLISGATGQISPTGDLGTVVHLLQGHPWLVLLAGMILGFLLQSSTATIALGIGFGASQHVGMDLLIPWILGTNLGIGLTALTAGWGVLEGRRLAVANLIAKGVGVLAVMFILLPLVLDWLRMTGAAEARQSANFNTLFNVAVALYTLPLVGPLAKAVEKWIVPASVPMPLITPVVSETYLDPKSVDTPVYALAQATRELLAMGDEVKSMLQTWWRAFAEGNAGLIRLAIDQDGRVDAKYHELKKFLTLVGEQEISLEDEQWQISLLGFSNSLESVGDIISTDLCPLVLKQMEYRHELTPGDRSSMDELYQKVVARLDIAMSILTTRDSGLARSFLSGKEALDAWCRERQNDHYQALRGGEDASLRSSTMFLEMLNYLRAINSHLSTIAYAIQTVARSVVNE